MWLDKTTSILNFFCESLVFTAKSNGKSMLCPAGVALPHLSMPDAPLGNQEWILLRMNVKQPNKLTSDYSLEANQMEISNSSKLHWSSSPVASCNNILQERTSTIVLVRHICLNHFYLQTPVQLIDSIVSSPNICIRKDRVDGCGSSFLTMRTQKFITRTNCKGLSVGHCYFILRLPSVSVFCFILCDLPPNSASYSEMFIKSSNIACDSRSYLEAERQYTSEDCFISIHLFIFTTCSISLYASFGLNPFLIRRLIRPQKQVLHSLMLWCFLINTHLSSSCGTKTSKQQNDLNGLSHIQTVGSEVTPLSMFVKMHHPHIPRCALRCCGFVYSYGCYSWWIKRICRTSECQLDGIRCLWQDYWESVHFRTAFISNQRFTGSIWPVEFNSSTSFKF